MADELLEIIHKFDPKLELKYNKIYIGLAENGQPNNFVIFRPQKNAIRIDARLERSDAIEQEIAASGLDVMDYDIRWSRYRIRLGKGDVIKHEAILRKLFLAAYGDVPEE